MTTEQVHNCVLISIAHEIQNKDKTFYFSIHTVQNDIDNWCKGEQVVLTKKTKVIKELFERYHI
tara:strand:+ start:300 stop:491 length:192 start_codon:yes stop_codon:yes gene_type:complete